LFSREGHDAEARAIPVSDKSVGGWGRRVDGAKGRWQRRCWPRRRASGPMARRYNSWRDDARVRGMRRGGGAKACRAVLFFEAACHRPAAARLSPKPPIVSFPSRGAELNRRSESDRRCRPRSRRASGASTPCRVRAARCRTTLAPCEAASDRTNGTPPETPPRDRTGAGYCGDGRRG